MNHFTLPQRQNSMKISANIWGFCAVKNTRVTRTSKRHKNAVSTMSRKVGWREEPGSSIVEIINPSSPSASGRWWMSILRRQKKPVLTWKLFVLIYSSFFFNWLAVNLGRYWGLLPWRAWQYLQSHSAAWKKEWLQDWLSLDLWRLSSHAESPGFAMHGGSR